MKRYAIGAVAALCLPVFAGAQAQVAVSDVEALYRAVNLTANAGAVVVVTPGTFALSAKDPGGHARPNGGRLVLQPGMALVGSNEYVDTDGDGIWDPRDDDGDGSPDTDPVRGPVFAAPASETIIDAGALTSGGQGAVRIGRDNRVERLTVRRTAGVAAAIDVNVLPDNRGMHAGVRDCLLEDGQRGLRIQHSQLKGLASSAAAERNILRRHAGTFGFGIQVQNGNSANSTWDVTLRNNLLLDNRFGLFVAGNGSTDVSSRVVSARNLYRSNQTGMNLFAGLDSGGIGGNGNVIHLTSVDDSFFDNVAVDNLGGYGAGVVAIAGVRATATATPSSGNTLVLQLLGTRWGGNYQGSSPRDLLVYGAAAVAGIPGVRNVSRVLIRKGIADAPPDAFQFIDSEPADLTKTDRAIVIGSDVAFVHANAGIEPLPEWLFTADPETGSQ